MSVRGVVRTMNERASSQVELSVSQSSEVSEPRTARAFSRADRKQLTMLPPYSRSRLTNSNTARGSIVSWRSRYACSICSAFMVELNDWVSLSPDWGSSDIR